MCDKKTPITPEGLFKLGAKVFNGDMYNIDIGQYDHCMEIFHDEDGWNIELIEVQPRGFCIPRAFKFIEEIKELYKSLTGEELKEVDNG